MVFSKYHTQIRYNSMVLIVVAIGMATIYRISSLEQWESSSIAKPTAPGDDNPAIAALMHEHID